jgi:type I restriction enzyme R subunit
MWLTGFDVPCLHTMYVDKPMRGHGLMQAIARVNRVYRDKPGGLVVDYLGLADQLKQALAAYTESGGQGTPSIDTAEAVAVLLEKYEICCGMMHGFYGEDERGLEARATWITGKPAERLGLIPPGQEHVLQQEELVRLAKEMREATNRGQDLGLNDDEMAFYDALAMNESAVKAMGSDELKVIAAELVTQVRKSVTIDWTVRESARARIRVMVRRILRKYGYPPDLQEEATRTVLEQAELMCADWAG